MPALTWCDAVNSGRHRATGQMPASRSGGLSKFWRDQLSTPGVPQIIDEHYPDHPDGHSIRQPRL